MSVLNALALSIGVLAGVATWLFLGPLAGALQIWVAFVAWGCFYHCGGKAAGFRNTVVCMAYGALLCWLTLLVLLAIPLAGSLGLPLWAGICVGVFVAIVVLSANVPALAVIPAQVYGFATTAGLVLLATPSKLTIAGLTEPSIGNPLIVIWLSLIVGAAFGYASETIGMAMVKKAPAAIA